MFKNTVLRRSQESIKRDIKSITDEMTIVQFDLKRLKETYGITDNNRRNRSATNSTKVPKEVWAERDIYVQRIEDLKTRVGPLRQELRELHIAEDTERNIALMGVFREIFNDSQRKEIMNEVDRRRGGETPMPLGLDFKELERYKQGYHKYRTLSKEYLDKMIEFRIMLTGLIEDGCRKFGNSEFLKFISPINRLIIPVEELKKIKIKHFI